MVNQFALPEQAWLFPEYLVTQKRISYVVHVHCQGLCPNGEPTGVAGHFQLYFDFQVDNLDEHLTRVETEPGPLPTHEMMVMLGGVAYSTARGMLLSKVQDTPLQGFSLPLRWPAEMLEASVRRLQTQEELLAASKEAKTPKKAAAIRAKKNPAGK